VNVRVAFFAVVAAALFTMRAQADAPPAPAVLPGAGFDGGRYATLWTKSPFAIATPEAVAASQDYQLVGMAQFDGISYVSLVDRQTQEHFVLASDKPVKNLTLVSISRGSTGASAIIQRNGEPLTLRQEEAAAPASGSVVGGIPIPQVSPPGAPLSSVGGIVPRGYFIPPAARIHRFRIQVPPPPSQ
jgi:hypothetical protein